MKKYGFLNICGKTAAIVFLLAVLPWVQADSRAQALTDIKTVLSSGYSRIYGDVGAAKQAALAESLRFAVQRASTDIISENQMTEDFETISRVLYDNPNQFVQDYRILEESQRGRSYRILVSATVMTDKIQEALAAAGLQTRPAELPTVLVMVAERHLDDIHYQYWWRDTNTLPDSNRAASIIAGIMGEEGFSVLAPTGAMDDIDDLSRGLALTADPANYEAAILGRRMGAHLVIVGTAETHRGQNRMGEDIRTYNGSVILRVVNSQTGRVLTTVRQQMTSMGVDEETAPENALADAAFQAGMQLASRVDSLWQKKEPPSGGIAISISGKNILPHLEQFRSTISETRNISAVRTLKLSPDAATLWVDFKGTPDELVDSLLKQSYGPFGINIIETSPDRLEIEMLRDMTEETLTE